MNSITLVFIFQGFRVLLKLFIFKLVRLSLNLFNKLFVFNLFRFSFNFSNITFTNLNLILFKL